MVIVDGGQKWDWRWTLRPQDKSPQVSLVTCPEAAGTGEGPTVEEEASPQILFVFPLTDSRNPRWDC